MVLTEKALANMFKMFLLEYVRFKKTSDMSGSMSGDLRNCQVSYLGVKISSRSVS